MLLWAKLTFKGVFFFLTDKNYRSFTFLLILYGNRRRFKETNLRFSKYKLKIPDALSFIWQIKEIYFQKAYKFNSARNNPLIIDCGANVGTSVLFFKELYPSSRITAFEADPKIFTYLKENLSKNSISDVNLVNKAVWIENSVLKFESEGADGASLIVDAEYENVIEVESIRLKDFVSEIRERIDMLKIDIEGAEVQVLADIADELIKIDHVFVEYHSFTKMGQSLGNLLQVLEKAGFKYFIETAVPRKAPFINQYYSYNPKMDLQLNIFAYRK
jgi:FkbM family methyltransferase